MKMAIIGADGKRHVYAYPDDYHMDELYCHLNGIGTDVSDDDVHRMMAESNDAITTPNGRFIRFSDYANSYTTLAQLGIDENDDYRYNHEFAKEQASGMC